MSAFEYGHSQGSVATTSWR